MNRNSAFFLIESWFRFLSYIRIGLHIQSTFLVLTEKFNNYSVVGVFNNYSVVGVLGDTVILRYMSFTHPPSMKVIEIKMYLRNFPSAFTS